MLHSQGQSDESQILNELAKSAPRTFIEFGFHPIQFNCAALARDVNWQGLLIDASERQTSDARAILPPRLDIVQTFLTLDNLDLIRSKFLQVGVLSIDVDGNDYYFLQRLIDISPAVICVEYNASFGRRSVTVPYDRSFNRIEKHPSGWYHGASLSALTKLAASNGYGLAAVSSAGCNAFFTKAGKLDADAEWRTNSLRDGWSKTTADQQWDAIRVLPLETV